MATLKPITKTCEPRDDVLEGGLADAHFAADLDMIVRDAASYPVYGDAEQFFSITHPTRGLRRLLERAFGRLSGAKVEGAEHGVIRSQTSFGGGKTHGLIAAYHLARGAKPSNIAKFIDPALVPEDCQVAAVVGDALDPIAGVVTNGSRSVTMWGEIAAQLGSYEAMRANDEERTAPGSGTWNTVIGDRPTLIIIDEIALHLRQLASSGNEDVRRQATAVPAFLKSLFQLAGAKTNVVVIVTLATRADAMGKETSDIEDLMAEGEGAFQEVMADTKSVLARSESIIRPADDAEIAAILKTRLFKEIDAKAAEVAGDSYKTFYEDLAAKGVNLPGGADQPTAYGDQVRESYPFHPELIRVLDKRLGTIPNFQRARGALKLLAEVIAGIWGSGKDTEIINVADIDLDADPVLTHLTVGLGRDDYEGVARVDIAGEASHASALDRTRFAGKARYATRAATTTFVHSLEQVATAGAGRGDYLLGTMLVGDDPATVEEALAALAERAWHLDYDGSRYRFLTEPNANAIVAEEARNIPNSQVSQELEDRIRKAFPDDGPVKARFGPTGPVDVPNEARLQLVVIHHDDATITARNATDIPDRVVEIREHAGSAGGFRTYRNGVVFLVADADQVQSMKDRLRFAMATQRIATSPDRLSQFSPEVRKKIETLADTAALETKVAIARCYSHLYYPTQDAHAHHLRHYEMPPKDKGAVPDKLTKTVVTALQDENKIRVTKPATDYLRTKAWQPKDAAEVPVRSLDDFFWQDHSMSLILDPTLLKEALRDGVANGTWVYYDPDQERTWAAGDPPPPVVLDSSAILYTPARAEELGLTRKPLRIDDITAAVVAQSTGADLRAALEARLGYEPTKKDIGQTLARAAAAGPSAPIVVTTVEPAEGVKAATPAQIEKAAFDTLWIVAPTHADALGVDRGADTKGPKPVEGRGVAGVALGQVSEKALDTPNQAGIALLIITATADGGEGIADIRSLGMAIPMLPKFEVTVGVEIELEFGGLTSGATIEVAGASSSYQAMEDAFLALAKKAHDVAGTMRIEVRPPAPIAPDGSEFEQIRNALTSVDPGEVTIRAEFA
jgi:hypothetical protein